MIINEISIYVEYCSKYYWIEKLFIKLLEVDTNNLSIEYVMMNNWFFMNKKKISKIDFKNLNNKIYIIEVYEKRKNRGVLTLEERGLSN